MPPMQPKPLNACSFLMVAPSLISALVKVMLYAIAACAPHPGVTNTCLLASN